MSFKNHAAPRRQNSRAAGRLSPGIPTDRKCSVVKILSYRHLAVVGKLQAEVVALRQVEVDAHLVKELLPQGALLHGGKEGGERRKGLKEEKKDKEHEVEEVEGGKKEVVGQGGRGAGGGMVRERNRGREGEKVENTDQNLYFYFFR